VRPPPSLHSTGAGACRQVSSVPAHGAAPAHMLARILIPAPLASAGGACGNAAFVVLFYWKTLRCSWTAIGRF